MFNINVIESKKTILFSNLVVGDYFTTFTPGRLKEGEEEFIWIKSGVQEALNPFNGEILTVTNEFFSVFPLELESINFIYKQG